MEASLVAVNTIFLVSFLPVTTLSGRNCSVLYLLNVQPYPDESEFSGFDGGLNLIPAAHLAAEEINNRSDILPEHHLEVIDIEAEACGRSVITKGLVNLYGELLNRDCIVGMMGFVCSTSTNLLAPITGHPAIGYITLANSASPAHRNIIKYPNLFHSISSASVHNTVIISLMQMFNWKKIGVVFDSVNVFFKSTATDFIQRIHNQSEVELTTTIALIDMPSKSDINKAFNTINFEEARISYWLENDGQYAIFLCEAYQRKFVWPGYVYILRYNPDIITNILDAGTSCSKDEIIQAMEGAFLVDYRLYVDDDTELFSGWNYSQFRLRYADSLDAFTDQIDRNKTELTYANSMYDQVWAFALAINASLPSIYSQDLPFLDYTLTNTETISNIIKRELLDLSFQGASGHIQFIENQEVPSFVNILQIQNGTFQLIAIYDPFSKFIIPNEHYPKNIPPDTFDTVYNLLPLWIGVCIFIIQSALFFLITTNMVLLTYWRNEREIKATSYLLGMLLTSSCYLLTIEPVIQTIYRMIVHNTTLHTVLCNISLWSTALGTDLMLATLLFRLFRVVHIFKPFQRASKYLSADMYILLYVLLTFSVKVLILIIWSIVDPYRSTDVRKYDSTTIPPVYRATPMCYCNQLGVWYAISYLYSVILLSFVVFFAVQTRRIKITDFKDTKKINLFVFLVIITLSTAIPLVVILSEIDIQIGAVVSQWIGIFSVPLLCQVCLIVPKVVPLAVKKKAEKGK